MFARSVLAYNRVSLKLANHQNFVALSYRAARFQLGSRALSTSTMSKSWLNIPASSHFSLQNLPFGIIETQFSGKRAGVAIGNHVIDLKVLAANNGFDSVPSIKDRLEVFNEPFLNSFAELGRPVHKAVREHLQDLLSVDTKYPQTLKDNEQLRKDVLIDQTKTKVKLHLPMRIGDYTDFYAGKNHAYNVGVMFRGPDNALQPNYTHLPVGYHGRASSVVVSGTPITRPLGQILAPGEKTPSFSYSKRLDIELELGVLLCKGNKMGDPIPISETEDHIFGYVLMNDWSARDIQAWEYVPLGPFNGKNFGTTISPWVVLADAMEPFRTTGIPNETQILPYLEDRKDNVFNINLEVDLTTREGNTTTITSVSSSNLLWSFNQMIAHHSIGGCPMAVGDLLGSGTISGTKSSELGSMLEKSKGGKEEIWLVGMETRTFLQDGDEVTIRGVCGEDGARVGFGECKGTIYPAISPKTFGQVGTVVGREVGSS